MTRDEMISKIENGSDIMFDVMGKHFTILTWTDDGIAIDEQHPNDGNMRYYQTAEKLVDSFLIGSKTLASLSDKIVITSYS